MKAEGLSESSVHEQFMAAAIEEARKSLLSGEGRPFGAVIVRGDEIVGRGRNRNFADYDPTAYSEILAIRDACKRLQTLDLSDCVLYTTSAPSPMCMGAIYNVGLKRIYYATDAHDAAAYGFPGLKCQQAAKNDYHSVGMISKSINREAGLQLFREYKRYRVEHYDELIGE